MLKDILELCKSTKRSLPVKTTERSVKQARHTCARFLRYRGIDALRGGWRGYRCWDCARSWFTAQPLPLFKAIYQEDRSDFQLVPTTED
jgi:hypothetical protein